MTKEQSICGSIEAKQSYQHTKLRPSVSLRLRKMSVVLDLKKLKPLLRKTMRTKPTKTIRRTSLRIGQYLKGAEVTEEVSNLSIYLSI